MNETLMAYAGVDDQAGSHSLVTKSTPTDAEIAWFRRQMQDGRERRSFCVAVITPGLTAIMLKANVANRVVRRQRVEQHIERLQRGAFRLTHQGIAFAKSGRLNDGQHRLMAILESGISAEIMVTFGGEEDEFEVIDQNAPRSGADVARSKGKSHAPLRHSAATLLYLIQHSVLRGEQQAIADFEETICCPLFEKALVIGARMQRVTTPTAGTVAYWVIASHVNPRNHQILDDFFDAILSGENLTGCRLALREFLRTGGDRAQGQAANCKRVAAIIMTWNAYRADKNRKRVSLSWPHVIKLPTVSP